MVPPDLPLKYEKKSKLETRDTCLGSEMFFHVIDLYEQGQKFEPRGCQEQTSAFQE